MMMRDDLLPVVDLWERDTADGVVIAGALAGIKVVLYRIADAPAGGPHWRLYFGPRQQATERDRARPTQATKPEPPSTTWQGVRQRQREGLPRYRRQLWLGSR